MSTPRGGSAHVRSAPTRGMDDDRARRAEASATPEHHYSTAGSPVLGLQAAAGNRAVGRLIAAGVRRSSNAVSTLTEASPTGEALEHEADRAADAIVPDAATGAGAADEAPASRPTSDESAIATLGRTTAPALANSVRGVRIHADANARATTNAHDAEALAKGRDIYIAPDQWAPETAVGQHLLAHELAHTVQQASLGSAFVQTQKRRRGRRRADDKAATKGGVGKVSGVAAGIGHLINAVATTAVEGAVEALTSPVPVESLSSEALWGEWERLDERRYQFDPGSPEIKAREDRRREIIGELHRRGGEIESQLRKSIPEIAAGIREGLAQPAEHFDVGEFLGVQKKRYELLDVEIVRKRSWRYNSDDVDPFRYYDIWVTLKERTWVPGSGLFSETGSFDATVKQGIATVDAFTGETNAYWRSHNGEAESEGLGPIEWAMDIMTGVAVLKLAGRLVVRQAAKWADRRALVSLERRAAAGLEGSVGADVGASVTSTTRTAVEKVGIGAKPIGAEPTVPPRPNEPLPSGEPSATGVKPPKRPTHRGVTASNEGVEWHEPMKDPVVEPSPPKRAGTGGGKPPRRPKGGGGGKGGGGKGGGTGRPRGRRRSTSKEIRETREQTIKEREGQAGERQQTRDADDVRTGLHARTAAPEPNAVLGSELKKAGELPPGDGFNAHHIVPVNAAPPELVAKLEEAGIKVNSAQNGVWLPESVEVANEYGRMIHQQYLHRFNEEYIATLERRLMHLSPEGFAAELASIKAELASGTFKLFP